MKKAENSSGWKRIVQENRNYVPLIESPLGIGAGIVVSRDGLVLTNRHVVDDGDVFMITFFDGTKAKAKKFDSHAKYDLAALRTSTEFDRCYDLLANSTDEIEAGDEVLAIGHPRGLTFSSSRGIISDSRRMLSDGPYVQTDVAINPGNSGGPLFLPDGRFVGMITLSRSDSHGLGFAIPADVVKDYLQGLIKRVQSKELRVPTHKEISSAQTALTPKQIVRASAQPLSLSFQEVRPEDNDYMIVIAIGYDLHMRIACDDTAFWVACFIDHLTYDNLQSAALLEHLLKLNAASAPASFSLSEENDLLVSTLRPSNDLDIAEAEYLVFSIYDAALRHCESLRRYIWQTR